MPVICHLHDLERKNVFLRGELPPEELDLDHVDELVHLHHPLHYELEVQKTPDGLLVQGQLRIEVDFECARCLTPFTDTLPLDRWSCLLPWEGEEKVAVSNDSVDLTPFLREDIVLAFPQHPLCKPDCPGLKDLRKSSQDASGPDGESSSSTPWSGLDKLEL